MPIFTFLWRLIAALIMLTILPLCAFSQCGSLSAEVTTTESRCAATGSITINASGGVAPQQYQYSISAGPVTTSFSRANSFSGLPPGTYSVRIKDLTANCFITKKNIIVSGNYVSPGFLLKSTSPTCMNGNDGTIFTTSQTGGRPPFVYTIISPSSSNVGTTSLNGTFTGLTAGLYYIQLSDSCGGIQTRAQEIIDYSWSILNTSTIIGSCEGDIIANIFLTNSNGITSPNDLFKGFQYGISRFPGDSTWFTTPAFSYNIDSNKRADILIKDDCGNIQSLPWSKPKPEVGEISISNNTCETFSATVTGQKNLNPDSTQYCLYDQTNTVLVSPCQSSPIFNNLPLGTYTMRINETCYDTTIIQIFAATVPIPDINDNLNFIYFCDNYSVTVSAQKDTSNVTYCLFKNDNTIPDSCNTTGQFINLKYDSSYCIQQHIVTPCIDTIIKRCFIEKKPPVSVNSNVNISKNTCTTFTATITGQQNITDAVYQLFDNDNNIQIGSDQSSPVFNNLLYGSYCIRIHPFCYDTTIVRCFMTAPKKLKIYLSAQVACTPGGGSNIAITFANGFPPFESVIYSPAGTIINTAKTSLLNYTFNNLPLLPSGQTYKVVTKDLCGNKDSATAATKEYYFNRSFTMNQKCPSGTSPNGTNNINFLVKENRGGSFTTIIIKKNGTSITLKPSGFNHTSNEHTFIFANLLPATYIFDTYSGDCDFHLYDTVLVPKYIYPSLSNSTGYYCDNNSQNINFSAINGVAPYQYQIFGSIPASPDITTPFQTSPFFNINNGTAYSLIRLRVLDACSNASINDVGFVSLAVPTISISNICFNNKSELSVDSFANATYSWYKRTYNPTDSIYLGSGNVYRLQNNISLADTGTYIAKTTINGECAVRLSYLTLYKGTNTCLSLHLTSTTNTVICASELPYTWNGKQYSTSGTYEYKTKNLSGVDSVATLNLTVKNISASITKVSICASALPYQWNGKLYYDSGKYVYHLTNSIGCDSSATLILNLKDTNLRMTNISICAPAVPYKWNGKTYSTSITDTLVFTNAGGCDSTEILNLVVNKPTTGDTTVVVCSSFEWYGKIYTSSTSATHTFTNVYGCDSIVTLHLLIKNPTTSYTRVNICTSALPYTWNNTTYITEGNYIVKLTNANGCDSLATLVLTLTPSSSSTTNISICENELPYNWNGNKYTAAGNYSVKLTNTAGCDSTVNLILAVNSTSTSTTSITICDKALPFTWNGHTYDASGTYNVKLTSASGCDSIATLILSIASLAPASLGNERRICPDDSVVLYPGKYDTYLWQDGSTNPTYTVKKTGKYYVTVSNGLECTSTSTVHVIVLDRCGDIFFPTAITPNGDRLNDNFGALGELAGVSDYSLKVYNRFGELVFETNDPYQRWDAIYKGKLTANYNYVWYATYTLNYTKRKMQKGNLVIIR